MVFSYLFVNCCILFFIATLLVNQWAWRMARNSQGDEWVSPSNDFSRRELSLHLCSNHTQFPPQKQGVGVIQIFDAFFDWSHEEYEDEPFRWYFLFLPHLAHLHVTLTSFKRIVNEKYGVNESLNERNRSYDATKGSQ